MTKALTDVIAIVINQILIIAKEFLSPVTTQIPVEYRCRCILLIGRSRISERRLWEQQPVLHLNSSLNRTGTSRSSSGVPTHPHPEAAGDSSSSRQQRGWKGRGGITNHGGEKRER